PRRRARIGLTRVPLPCNFSEAPHRPHQPEECDPQGREVSRLRGGHHWRARARGRLDVRRGGDQAGRRREHQDREQGVSLYLQRAQGSAQAVREVHHHRHQPQRQGQRVRRRHRAGQAGKAGGTPGGEGRAQGGLQAQVEQAQGRRGQPPAPLRGGEAGQGDRALDPGGQDGQARAGGDGAHPGQGVPLPGGGRQRRGRVGAPRDPSGHRRQEPLR
ncbi:unnamed protein product, partial [Ixodes pacificus]